MNTRKRNLKRPLSLLLAVLLVVSGSIIAVSAEPTASGTQGENLTWVLDNGTLTISGEGEMEGSWISNVDGSYTVSYSWDAYKDQITAVVIENGVTSIGDGAFEDCIGLTNITIPDSVTYIGGSAFYNTGYYNNESNWENDVLYLNCYLLDSKESISGTCNIKEGTSLIAGGAFGLRAGLTSVTIPDSVTSIGNEAFYNCAALTSVTIPNKDIKIGYKVFSYCDNLTIYSVKGSRAQFYAETNGIPFSTIPVASANGTCGDNLTWVFKDGKLTIFGEGEMKDDNYGWGNFYDQITSVVIGKGITSIGDDAFYGCTGLTSITIPDSVTRIGNLAFENCTGLTSITIPDSVASIASCAFRDCTGLTSITIPDSVTYIGGYAFEGCTGLTSITIPDSITYIWQGAFTDTAYYNNESNWENDVLYIGSYLVDTRKSISGAYSVKEGTSLIAAWALRSCKELTSITIPDSVISIGDSAFSYCTGLKSITIPDSVTSIDWDAFEGCAGLTSITIPGSVTIISGEAFRDCTGLKNVTISDGVTGIEMDAFNGCTGLTNITIPDSVTSIGDGAFEDCTGVTSITIPETIEEIGEDAFTNTAYYNNESNWENDVLYIGKYLIEAKKSISGAHSIKEGTTFIASGAFSGCTELMSITLPNSFTSIGDYAFGDCTGLTSITIPDSVTEIGWSAFEGCTGLTSITIPDSVTDIYYAAFSGCIGLASITLPDTITWIGEDAFTNTAYYNNESNWENDVLYIGKYLIEAKESISGAYSIKEGTSLIADSAFTSCTGLTSITIPESVADIGYDAFKDCTGLTNITIPDSVTGISWNAFANTAYYNNASNWENDVLYIGNNLIEAKDSISGAYSIKEGTSLIADDAFEYCEELNNITIPDSVTSIGENAFFGCIRLTSVTIPDSVTSIAYGAFGWCDGLTSVTIPESVTWIGSNAFRDCDDLTIYGKKGSYAETYAKENEIPFKAIGSDKPTVSGDVDGDGVLEATDCLKARRAFFGLSPLTEELLRAVDFNNNGKLDATECLKQRRMFFGLA